MKPSTVDWVSKAEGDFHTMEREYRARTRRSFDNVCFHAQQCAEKYLKGRLHESDVPFPKIHALLPLLNDATKLEPAWEPYREDLGFLTAFGVAARYPGEAADKEIARKAVECCRRFRKAARAALGCDEPPPLFKKPRG